MQKTWVALLIIMIALVAPGRQSPATAEQFSGDNAAVPVEIVADYLHSVIDAH